MPLPLIPALIIGGTALFGAKKAYDAKSDYDLAQFNNERSSNLVEKTNKEIEECKEKTNNSLKKLGKIKLEILSGSVYEFVECFEKLKKMNITEGEGIEEIRNINSEMETFTQLRTASHEAKTALTGGLGIAGGTMLLGGLTTVPALAIGAIFVAKKAEKAYWESHENYEQAKTYAEQGKTVVSKLNAVSSVSNQMCGILKRLNAVFEPQVSAIKEIVNGYENRMSSDYKISWNDFTVDEKKTIAACAESAKVMKIILDTAILNENGELQEVAKRCVKMNFSSQLKADEIKGRLGEAGTHKSDSKSVVSKSGNKNSSSVKPEFGTEYQEKLSKLIRCKKVGLLTEEEYEQKLAEIEKLKR